MFKKLLLTGTAFFLSIIGSSTISYAREDTIFTFEWTKKYPSYTICEGITIEGEKQECILSSVLEIKIDIDMFTRVKHLFIKNPNEYVKFILPQKGYICHWIFLVGYRCKETPVDSSFLQFYFTQKRKTGILNLSPVLKDIKEAKLIIDELNTGIKKGEIPVEFKYSLIGEEGYGTFIIHIPRKYLAYLKRYVELIENPNIVGGSPAVIGIDIKTPLVEKVQYFELYTE